MDKVDPSWLEVKAAQEAVADVCALAGVDTPVMQLTGAVRDVAACHKTGRVSMNPRFVSRAPSRRLALAQAVVDLGLGKPVWWVRAAGAARHPVMLAAVGATGLYAVPALYERPGLGTPVPVLLWMLVLLVWGVWHVRRHDRLDEVSYRAHRLLTGGCDVVSGEGGTTPTGVHGGR